MRSEPGRRPDTLVAARFARCLVGLDHFDMEGDCQDPRYGRSGGTWAAPGQEQALVSGS